MKRALLQIIIMTAYPRQGIPHIALPDINYESQRFPTLYYFNVSWLLKLYKEAKYLVEENPKWN